MPAVHVLLDAVANDRVMPQAVVARMIVHVDGRTRRGVVHDEPQ